MSGHRKSAPTNTLRIVSAVLLSAALHVAALDSGPFDCHFSVGDAKYDLSGLGGVKVLNRTRELPPSTYVDELRFDLCADLPPVENRPPEDQVLCFRVEQFSWLTTLCCTVSFRYKGMYDHDKPEG